MAQGRSWESWAKHCRDFEKIGTPLFAERIRQVGRPLVEKIELGLQLPHGHLSLAMTPAGWPLAGTMEQFIIGLS